LRWFQYQGLTLEESRTYAPFTEALFDTRSVDFVHAVEILLLGVMLLVVLVLEKSIRRRGWVAN